MDKTKTAKTAKVKKDKTTSGQISAVSGTRSYQPTVWGTTVALFDVELPSGQVCQAKRIGPTELVKNGLLSRVDILSSIVQTDHIDRVSGRADADLSEADKEAKRNAELVLLMKDPDKLLAAMGMIDDITCMAVVQPKVNAIPLPRVATMQDIIEFSNETKYQAPIPDMEVGQEFTPPRLIGGVYVDSIPEDDKMFLFQWTLGGSNDLAEFREGLGQRMDALSAIQADELQAERTDGDD